MKALVYWMVALMVGLGACTSDVDKDKDDDDDEIAEWDEFTITLKVSRPSTTTFELTSKASDEYDPLNGRYPSSKVDFPTELEINWGDGQTTNSNSHAYQDAGTYLVKIKGKGIGTFSIKYEYTSVIKFTVKSWPNAIYINTLLDSIDFTKCPKLENITCYIPGDDIPLDFSKCPKLKYLYIRGDITDLNLTGCTELRVLNCTDCKLTKLDVSSFTKLEILECSKNQLTNLDISKNTKLTRLEVIHLNVNGNQLTNLDVSKNTKLTFLRVEHNQLTNLDVSKNTELAELYVENNQLTNLDLSNNTELTNLYVGYNQLTNLDLSKHTELVFLNVEQNQLTNLDLSKDTKLEILYCNKNQLNHSALNKIYNALPHVSRGSIHVKNNPSRGDTYLATQKGWTVW